MNLREHAVDWVEKHGTDSTFHVADDLYKHLEGNYPSDCDSDVLTPDGKEPKWRKDARWALQDCKRRKTVRHVGSGMWQRT